MENEVVSFNYEDYKISIVTMSKDEYLLHIENGRGDHLLSRTYTRSRDAIRGAKLFINRYKLELAEAIKVLTLNQEDLLER